MTTKNVATKTTTRARATKKIDNATNVANVETNVANDDATTTTNVSRETTRAIRAITNETTFINVDTTHAKIVKMSSGNMRIDHANCEHATSGNDGKRDRSKCRARIEKFIRENENA